MVAPGTGVSSGVRNPYRRMGFSTSQYDASARASVTVTRSTAFAQPVSATSTAGRVNTQTGQCHR